MEKRIQAQLRAKKGMLAIARELKVGTGTVQRIKREMEGNRPFGSAVALGSAISAQAGARPIVDRVPPRRCRAD
jgi:hypothetical protein